MLGREKESTRGGGTEKERESVCVIGMMRRRTSNMRKIVGIVCERERERERMCVCARGCVCERERMGERERNNQLYVRE